MFKRVAMFFIFITSLFIFITSFANENTDNAYTDTPMTSETDTHQNKLDETLQATMKEMQIREKIINDMKERQDKIEQDRQKAFSDTSTQHSIWHKILFYIPNRLIDLSDIFSIGAGVGPEVSMELAMTNYCKLGGSYGDKYFIQKGYIRQYGGGYSAGFSLPIIYYNKELKLVDYTFGYLDTYVILNDEKFTIPSPSEPVYRDGYEDFWKIGFKGGWLFDFEFYFHPVALANFFTGFAFYRLTDTNDL